MKEGFISLPNQSQNNPQIMMEAEPAKTCVEKEHI